MSKGDIVRAWKDAEYRQSLSVEEQALLPEHPAGSIDLADDELDQVAGALSRGFTECNTSCLTFDTDMCVCILLTTKVLVP